MKYSTYFCASAIAAAAILSACSSKSTADTDKTASFATEPTEWADSITSGSSTAVVKIRAEYPIKGPAPLVEATRSWIAASLACSDTLISGVHRHDSNAKDLCAYVGSEILKESQADFKAQSPQETEGMEYEFLWNITAPIASDTCVTYVSEFYCYTGGAHGSTQVLQSTFDAQGTPLTLETMFTQDATEPLRRLVTANLASQYFNEDDIQAMAQDLLVPVDSLPLPSTPPAFFPDGIRFIYQQYEIAPYSAGIPTCTIPYSVLRSFLTPFATALIP